MNEPTKHDWSEWEFWPTEKRIQWSSCLCCGAYRYKLPDGRTAYVDGHDDAKPRLDESLCPEILVEVRSNENPRG